MLATEQFVSDNSHIFGSGCFCALSGNSDACTGPYGSEPDFVGLIKSSSLSLYCPSREDSGSVGFSIRALDHSFCDCGTRESDSR